MKHVKRIFNGHKCNRGFVHMLNTVKSVLFGDFCLDHSKLEKVLYN